VVEYLNCIVIFILSVSSISIFSLSLFASRRDLAYIPVMSTRHDSRGKQVRLVDSINPLTGHKISLRVFTGPWRWNL
jgi:hypothetical protein